MSKQYIDLTIVSAQDLKSVSFFGKNQPFAVAYVHPSSQRRTKVAVDGGPNPVWKERLDVPVDLSLLQRGNAVLTIKIYSQGGFIGDKVIGSAHIPLSEINKDGIRAIATYQLRRPSGRAKGSVSIIANLRGESGPQAHHHSGPQDGVYPVFKDPSAKEESVYSVRKPSDENPVMAYPASGFHSDRPQIYPPTAFTGYSGSSNPPPPDNFHQYNSAYPPPSQSYYPPPTYPPVVPPQPPRKNRLGSGGGLGLGAGLLGGALGGLLLGDVIGDMSYDAGYDDGFDSSMADGYYDGGFDSGMADDWGGGY